MTLLDRIRIPLTALFLLTPLLTSCADDGGSEGSSETETGDGDGDPGDGDGSPGDGDGSPGDGDGSPGDGDGSPGDGDGSPGDGDGAPGDGDGAPGDGDGAPGDGDGEPGDCDPFDAKGIGLCDAFFGYTWTGDNCIGVSGCECSGTDCDKLYDSPEGCWNAHALCELGDPCAADDAQGIGLCAAFFGWAWDGFACVGISGCECSGSDCPNLPLELDECEAAHGQCFPPPPDGCAALDEDECLASFECMTLNGSPLLKLDDDSYCAEPSQFLGCDEGAICLQVFTWGCGPGDLVALFPNSCLPPGWFNCDPPVVDPLKC